MIPDFYSPQPAWPGRVDRGVELAGRTNAVEGDEWSLAQVGEARAQAELADVGTSVGRNVGVNQAVVAGRWVVIDR